MATETEFLCPAAVVLGMKEREQGVPVVFLMEMIQ
jgi:hypothetical protein